MSPAEQEHADHVFGSASEFQNCFSEARMVCSSRNGDESVKIAAALAAGKFVVVSAQPYYCKATDAIAGEVNYMVGAFDSRVVANERAAWAAEDDEARVYVLPAEPLAPVAVVEDAEDVPF